MKKSKKRLKIKINPEKSNKMIWAVSIGLLILFSMLYFTSTRNDSALDRSGLFKNTLNYLEKTEGITDIKSFPDKSSVNIYYEPDPNSRSRIDYRKMAVFAAVKLSNKLKGERITFQLISGLSKSVELTITVMDGRVISKNITE